eukprot:COSAG01_NODE_13266_length_1610_cov_1.538054_3_plen_48_part_01
MTAAETLTDYMDNKKPAKNAVKQEKINSSSSLVLNFKRLTGTGVNQFN